MTDDEKLMQQALTALEGLTEKVSRTGFADSGAYTNALDAVDLMHERLAQPAQQPGQEPPMQQQLADALQSLDIYKQRVGALQQWQHQMRDPERTIVCDIIANGRTLEPAGDRYKLAEQQVQEPVAGKGKELSEQLKLCARNVAFVASGRVDMSSAAMQEMFALIDHVCVGIDSPQPAQQPVQEPFCHVYEYDSPHGLHRELYPREWNGMQPSRTLPLYTAPQPRQWVGLTHDERDAWQDRHTLMIEHEVIQELDDLLREKNT